MSRPDGSLPKPARVGQPRDALFTEPSKRLADFDFGPETVAVFDDMVDRSVPFYREIQRMMAELVRDFAAEDTTVYDLGCATGTTLLQIAQALPEDRRVRLIGIDNSPEMLELAKEKLTAADVKQPFELHYGDLNQVTPIANASVVLMALTLQFVRPLYRQQLIRTVRDGLTENGCLILVEKVLGESSTYNRLFIKYYYDMKKRNGYSDSEITHKREALENVLVPYRLEENKELLRAEGFRHVDVFFKWFNFCAIVAMK